MRNSKEYIKEFGEKFTPLYYDKIGDSTIIYPDPNSIKNFLLEREKEIVEEIKGMMKDWESRGYNIALNDLLEKLQ